MKDGKYRGGKLDYTIVIRSLVLFVFLIFVSPLFAGTQGSEENKKNQEPTYAEQAEALQEQIDHSLGQVRELEKRRDQHKGWMAQIYDRRIESENIAALEATQQLIQLVIKREAAGKDPGLYRKTAINLLKRLPATIRDHAYRLLAKENPERDVTALSATEQIALEANLERLARRILALFKIYLRSLELSDQLGLDTTVQAEFFTTALADAAANQSVALELAREQDKVLTRQSSALPEDKELAARAKVNSERIKRLNDTLRQLVEMMESRGMRVVEYRQQLVAATGTVTTDLLDYEVFKGLVGRWLHTAASWARQNLPGFLFKLLLFLFILWASMTLAGITRRMVQRGLNRTSTHLSQLLRRMIIASAGNIVLILGLLFGLAQIGISVGPLLAGLGIAGFIIGFALQDTLGNFASGMLILLYRPYDVGDFIQTNEVMGKVSHMSLVNTTVLTIDNQTLVLPNSKIWGDVIKNITAQRERRVDMIFGISYSDDIAKAEKVLNEIVQSHSKVLDDPEAIVRLHALNESSVDFVVRPWVKTEDYWDVYWDITRSVKMRFDEVGISIPFPQRDVHLFSSKKPSPASAMPLQTEQSEVSATGSQPVDDTPAGEAGTEDNESP